MTYLYKFLNKLNNLTFAIIILLVIAFASAIGTILEQNKDTQFYLNNYPTTKPLFNFITSDLIFSLGLNHVYTSWWFISLIILLMLSLILCTVTRQLPNLKLARLWQFYTNSDTKSKFHVRFKVMNLSLTKLTCSLEKQNYNIKQLNNFVYAYKGITGRVSPIFVHFSLVLVLVGSFLGALQGRVNEIFVNVNQEQVISNTCNINVNDFKIAYNTQGLIDQFYSDLTIETKPGLKTQKTIYVNEPLNYDGVTIYQTDWSIDNLVISVDENNYYRLPLQFIELQSSSNANYWLNRLNLFDQDLICVINDLTGNIYIYDQNKDLISVVQLGDSFRLKGHNVTFNMLVPSTGLQVKVDYFVSFVYLGFLFLMLSTLTSYISYSQVWLIKQDNIIYIFGNTNRAKFTFKKQLLQVIK